LHGAQQALVGELAELVQKGVDVGTVKHDRNVAGLFLQLADFLGQQHALDRVPLALFGGDAVGFELL